MRISAVCMRAHQWEGKCFQPEDVAAKCWPWDASESWGISLFLLQKGWLLMCHSSRRTSGLWTSRADTMNLPLGITCCHVKAQTSTSGSYIVATVGVGFHMFTGVLDFICCCVYPESSGIWLSSTTVCCKTFPMKRWGRSCNRYA